jgi:Sulfotransferase domain
MALKVVGAGLGRTGTASLKVALEELGIGRCYHMGEVLQNQSHMDNWIDAADGNPDWDSFLGDYDATVDYPACTYWCELSEYYPDSRVLLSVRDATSWYESTHATILSPKFKDFIAGSPFGDLCQKTIWDTLDNRMEDRDFMVDYFDRRVEEIREAVPADRLLVYEVQQGWEPLCNFLELPVPDKPFPRINSRHETEQLIATFIEQSGDVPSEQALNDAAASLFEEPPGV